MVYWSVRRFISSSAPILIVSSNYCHFLSVLKAEIKAWDPWEGAFQMYTTAPFVTALICASLLLTANPRRDKEVSFILHWFICELNREVFNYNVFLSTCIVLSLWLVNFAKVQQIPHIGWLCSTQPVCLFSLSLIVCWRSAPLCCSNEWKEQVFQLSFILQMFLPERK